MLVGTALGGPEVQRLHTGEIIRPYLFPNLKNERKNGNEKSLKLVAEKNYVDNDMQSKRKKRKRSESDSHDTTSSSDSSEELPWESAIRKKTRES